MRQTRARTFFRPLVVLSCVLIGVVSAGLSGDAAPVEFTPTRYPFQPELTVNEHPTLCPAFLRAATRAFLSDSYLIDLFRQPWPDAANPEVVWLDWRDGPGRSSGPPIKFVELDFGNDRPAIVIAQFNFFRRPNSGRHDVLVLVDNRRRFDALAEQYAHPSPFKIGQAIIDGLPETYPGHAIAISEGPHPWAVLEHRGRYFVFNADPRAAENPIESPDPLDGFAVHEIRPDMTVRRVCAVRVFPISGPTEVQSFRETKRIAWDRHWPEIELPDALVGPPELLPLYHTLATMLGNDASCPSRRGVYRLRHSVEMDKLRVAFRPWVGPGTPISDRQQRFRPATIARTREFLAYWATEGPWNYRVHRRLDGELAAARTALTAYYRDAFGVPAAQAKAAAGLDYILPGHFRLNYGGEISGTELYSVRPLAERIDDVVSRGVRPLS